MPIILCRHGATLKNIAGGIDDRFTPLHETGIVQARETGARLLDFCLSHGIDRLRPITTGYVRAEATCDEALARLDNSVTILPRIVDERIAEIKFLPREVIADSERPGLFGRVIEGASLAEITKRLSDFTAEHFVEIDDRTLVVAFGHRTTHRVLAMIQLSQTVAWMEALPRMDNCELWLLQDGNLKILHPGYPAERDGLDTRRFQPAPRSPKFTS